MTLMNVAYAVYGDARHAEMTRVSIASLRRFHPEAKIRIACDRDSAEHLAGLDVALDVIEDFGPAEGIRIDGRLKLIALEKEDGPVLFLDTDTYVDASLDDAWALLDRFDVMGVHAPVRRRLRHENSNGDALVSDAPEGFAEINTGVLFLSGREPARAFLGEWRTVLEQFPGAGDQYTFMDALYRSPCRFYVLPAEYNCRIYMPQALHGRVRILHGYHKDMPLVASRFNASTGTRSARCLNGRFDVLECGPRAPGPRGGDKT